jgi:Immunity protein 53
MSALADLQEWYQAQCNLDWERQFGVSIGTLDNPGWTVTIDLGNTDLRGKPFPEVKDLESEKDWIHCRVEGTKFYGAGGPGKLEEILQVFLNWANPR